MIDSKHSTRRLAISYFIIIMTMSIIFSSLIYFITSSNLNRPIPAPRIKERAVVLPPEAREGMRKRYTETRLAVLSSLMIINVAVGFGGAWFSYYLARRTLKPIEESIEKQNQFISDASHELRTPLTALQTSNEVALRKKVITEEKARQVFESNIIETKKLCDLSDALLNLTKTNREDLKNIKIKELLEDIVSKFNAPAEEKSITIKINSPNIEISAAPIALEQIISNLLDNAIKYSSKNTLIEITVEETSASTIISVKDNGIGIKENKQPYIFERFYQTDASRTRTKGSGYGLGLAIAKELADRYNYKIDFISKKGSGSTFSITIQ